MPRLQVFLSHSVHSSGGGHMESPLWQYHWGEPERAPPSIAAGRNVCLSICTVRRQHVLSLCTNAHALASPNTCINQSPPVFLATILECLKVHILQSVESSMESHEQPRSPLNKSGRKRQMSEEKLCWRRERDRECKGSESAEERELRCSLWRQERDRYEACSAQQREDCLQQERQCVRWM